MFHGAPPPPGPQVAAARKFFGLTTYFARAFQLVWTTSKHLTVAYILATIWAGLIPGLVAYLSKLLIDAVVAAQQHLAQPDYAYRLIAIEGAAVLSLIGAQRLLSYCQDLFGVLLGQRVNVLILEKALDLELTDFEDSDTYDKLTRARREASRRPFSLVQKSVELAQTGLTLIGYLGLLWHFSPWACLLLIIGALPSFVVEAKFSQASFRVFNWKAAETREQVYLESLVGSDTYVKEVKLFDLGSYFLKRYQQIFEKVVGEDFRLAKRHTQASFLVGSLGVLVLYLSYAAVILAAVQGRLTLGEMSMYLLIFKQGQTALATSLITVVRMYDDNLYLSNLYEFLDLPRSQTPGTQTSGPNPGDGIRFESVSFAYPDNGSGNEKASGKIALADFSLHLKPGEIVALVGQNGSGKTTFVKLLAGLYRPTSGRILWDGLPLEQWDPAILRHKVSVIFQDFVRYYFVLGENIGVGDVQRVDDQQGWERAAHLGLGSEVVSELPKGYQTQLGRFFRSGQELSGGQWQKVALSRAFMRESAEVLVLDEPTSAVDAKAEVQLFEQVRSAHQKQMVVLISHRFSTVRHADHIIVLDKGHITESGTHAQLLDLNGSYAELFRLQAAGYQ